MAMMKRLLCCCVGQSELGRVGFLPKEKALKKAAKAEQDKAKKSSHKSLPGKEDANLTDVPPDVVPAHGPSDAVGDKSSTADKNQQKTVRVEITIPASSHPQGKQLDCEMPGVNANSSKVSKYEKYRVEEKTASFLTLDLNAPPAVNPNDHRQAASDPESAFDVANKKPRMGSGRSLYVLKKKSPEAEVLPSPDGNGVTSSGTVDKVLLLQSKAPNGTSGNADNSDSEQEKKGERSS